MTDPRNSLFVLFLSSSPTALSGQQSQLRPSVATWVERRGVNKWRLQRQVWCRGDKIYVVERMGRPKWSEWFASRSCGIESPYIFPSCAPMSSPTSSFKQDPLISYSKTLHDYTLELWTESRRVAEEKARRKLGRMEEEARKQSHNSPTTQRPRRPWKETMGYLLRVMEIVSNEWCQSPTWLCPLRDLILHASAFFCACVTRCWRVVHQSTSDHVSCCTTTPQLDQVNFFSV